MSTPKKGQVEPSEPETKVLVVTVSEEAYARLAVLAEIVGGTPDGLVSGLATAYGLRFAETVIAALRPDSEVA